jgi:D-beta-D-heptose 7-phosphate kinase / D-beta-D-heptose 1-phosphate adenosyltransferase
VTGQDAERLLRAIQKCRILVVGDLMLDEYCRGRVERISPEAPVPILNVTSRDATLGGAGNVVKNLRSLNACVAVVGLVGDDATAEQIRKGLSALGVSGSSVIRDARRVSTRKVRFVCMEHGQQIFRADEETAQEAGGEVEQEMIRHVRERAAGTQAILCSDYMKGVLTPGVLQAAFEAGREHHLPVIVAPKDKEAQKYRGASVLVPNLRELSRLVGTPVDGDAWLAGSAKQLAARLGLAALLVTRGSAGMTLFESQGGGLERVDIPTVARKIYDVTGAGDTALAAFAGGIAAGATREEAARLANISAGIVVGKRGTAIVTSDEILEYLEERGSPDGWERGSPETLRPAGGE